VITYVPINLSNRRFYIGSTTDFNRRWKEHLNSSANYPFQNALRKNPEAFEWEVCSDDSDEPILEQALLDMWFGAEQCYNLSSKCDRPPSQKGIPKTLSHKQKIGKALKGKERSSDHCQNISKGKKGINPFPKGIPEEVIAKRSANRIANGKKWTAEQKQKMSKKRQLPAEEIKRRIDLINHSNIDLNKWGVISKVAKLLEVTHPAARHFLSKHYKNFHDVDNNES
jgi:group I intron endonuclease